MDTENHFTSRHGLNSAPMSGCFLVLWKPFLVRFCVVVLLLVSFQSFVLRHLVIVPVLKTEKVHVPFSTNKYMKTKKLTILGRMFRASLNFQKNRVVLSYLFPRNV